MSQADTAHMLLLIITIEGGDDAVLGISHATSAGAFERFPLHQRKKTTRTCNLHTSPAWSSQTAVELRHAADKRPACRIFDRPRSSVPRGLPLRSALTDDSGGPADWLMPLCPTFNEATLATDARAD